MQEPVTTYAIQLEMSGAKFSLEFISLALERFFLIIAFKVNSCSSGLIGHLKGFCTGHENDYLKISFVSANGGADVSGIWVNESTTARLTVNIIVLGFIRQNLNEIIDEAIKEMMA